MAIRPDAARQGAEDRIEARTGTVFGREWWGLDRDRLEDELARQEASKAQARDDGIKPH